MYSDVVKKLRNLRFGTENLHKASRMLLDSINMAIHLLKDLNLFLANNLNEKKECKVCGGIMIPNGRLIKGYICVNCGILDKSKKRLFEAMEKWNQLMTFDID